MIKSFRGLIADGDVATIRLSTNNGLTGYRVVKFEAMPYNPTNDNLENIIQLWKDKDAADGADDKIDFNSPLLLATLFIQNNAGDDTTFIRDTVIFDSEKFNQDIYVSSQIQSGGGSSEGVNFYLELEQVRLDMNEATVATLKDLRGSA